ncbi:MAG: hypothetical protein KJZ77_19055 [Anaerolineales bacterium]|nr:hypothetical protein [Anaerolineales bacterium]
MHKISLLLLLISSVSLSAMELAEYSVQAPRCLGDLKVIAADDGFYVQKGDLLTRVQNHDVDQILKDARKARAMKALKNSYISVSQYSNGDYKLKLNGRLNGGGLIGANVGFYAGKFAVHFIGHGTIAIVSACTGPAAAVTAASLEATFLPVIEGASNIVGLAAGIGLSVATGPV